VRRPTRLNDASRRLTAARSVTLALGSLAVSLAACGGGNTADSTPTDGSSSQDSTATTVGATTTTEAVLGANWAEVAGWETVGATRFHLGSAGERALAVAVDDTPGAASALRIVELVDGEWIESADLVAMGLPLEEGSAPPGDLAGQVAIGGDASVAVVAVLINPVPGTSADGVSADLWLAIDDGSGWTLSGPGDTGIDQRLQGVSAFRFMGVAGVAVANGNVHVVFEGQWWYPYQTSGADFAVVTRSPDGSWTTFAGTEQDAGTGRMEPVAVAASPSGVAVAVGRGMLGPDDGVRIWLSADGLSWQPGPVLTDDTEAFLTVSAVAATEAGFLVAVNLDPLGESRYSALWHSVDGVTWQLATPPQLGAGDTLTGLTDVDGQFIATDSSGNLWSSIDGNSWETLLGPGGMVPLNGALIAIGDRLALLGETAGHITG